MPYPVVAIAVAAGVIIGGILYYVHQSNQAHAYNYSSEPFYHVPPSSFERRSNDTRRRRPRKPTSPEPNTECIICLEAVENGKSVVTLKCNHRYHENCFNEWYNVSQTCPICRNSITRG